jgi:DnaJ-domain-containing protein 1
MVDFLAATYLWGQGFQSTSVSNEYSIKIYVNTWVEQKRADERVQKEIATFMKDNKYVSYRVMECRRKTFLFHDIFYEYIIRFVRNSSTFNQDTSYSKPKSEKRQSYRETAQESASEEKDPYKILDIATNASWDEISVAYKKMAQMYHPDKVAGLAPEYQEIAEKRMKILNAAYEQLRRKHGK